MTSGAQVSAAAGEKGKTVREGRNSGRGPKAGLGRSAAPRPSSYFFSSLLCFCFELCLKLAKTSDLNLSHTLEFCKTFFWYLKHTCKVFDLRAKQNLNKRYKCKKNAMHDMMHDFM
jgi:hypothetical protein